MPKKANTPTTLVQKMHKIMAELDFIKKDKKNTNSNYNYASEKAIKIALHDQFVKHGVIFTMSASNPRMLETCSRTKAGDTTKIVAIDTNYCFMNVDDKDDKIEGTCLGSGNGRDDKGIYAAITGALKYVLTSAFMIPTGDDAERDGNREVNAYESPDDNAEGTKIPPAVPKPAPTAKPVAAKPVAQKPVVAKKPVASKPVAGKKPVASKPVAGKKPVGVKPSAQKPVAQKPVAKAPVKVWTWGEPEGDSCMSEKDKNNVLVAFAKHDIVETELVSVSGMPILEWTANIKEVALNNFGMLEDGTLTKAEAIAVG